MAPPQRKPQEPRVLFVPAGTAPPRMAALAHRPATKDPSHPSGETRPGIRPPRRLCSAVRSITTAPFNSQLIQDADQRRLFRAYLDQLSLPRLPRSLRCTTTLLGAAGAAGTPASGRFVVYQRRLAHGSARFLDRLERCGAPAQSTPGGQSQSLPDSPLGPHPPPRQPYPGTRRAPVAARLAGALRHHPRAPGNPGRPGPLPRASVIARPTGPPSA